MSLQQTIDSLGQLSLKGMAEGLRHQSEAPSFSEMPFENRLSHLVHAERSWRDTMRFKRIIKSAKLKIVANPDEIDFRAGRNLDRSQIGELLTCRWVEQHDDVVITGATGTGKTWLACALGVQAARFGHTLRYARTATLLETMLLAHKDGSIAKIRAAFARFDLLVLDDFGLASMTEQGKQDLLDIVDSRTRSGSIIYSGQLPLKDWHDYIASPMVADAIVDRVASNAHRLQLHGESMRRVQQRPN